MSINIGQLLAGIAGGSRGLSVSLSDIDARKRYEAEQEQQRQAQTVAHQDRLATRAMQEAAAKDAAEGRMRDDALKGIRTGAAPNSAAMSSALDMGGQMIDATGMGGVGGSMGIAAMKAADAGRYDGSRYEQVTPSAYLDHYQTPEAVKGRADGASAMRQADAQQRTFQQQAAMQEVRDKAAEQRQHATIAAQDRRTANLIPRSALPTEFERKAALVTPRAEEANAVLSKGPEAPSLRGKLSRIPLVGQFLTSEYQQSQNHAAEELATAILRLESGAAITESEVRSYARQFNPQPGDSPTVLAQKTKARETAVDALRKAQGRAAPAPSRNPWRP